MFSDYSVLALQHLLPSQESFFTSVSRLKGSAGLFVLPKHYSEIPGAVESTDRWQIVRTAQELLEFVKPNTLVIDEGGVLHAGVAELGVNVVGVEQTSNGVLESWTYPVVLVCRSAAKLLFESQIIAIGITRKLKQLGLLGGNRHFLVLGMGALGSALKERLGSIGELVVGYDLSINNRANARDRTSLLSQADVILGCSGSKSIHVEDLSNLKEGCILASCSSKQVEFQSLLSLVSAKHLFADRKLEGPNGNVFVLNGGFPINFDRKIEWERPEEIWLTRQLMLAGVRQALQSSCFEAAGYRLEGSAQSAIVNEWRRHSSIADQVSFPEAALDAAYFDEHSEGV